MPVKENQVKHLPPVVSTISDTVYHSLDYEITNLQIDNESQEYEACTFKLNGLKIIHRLSKITPTKTGQFVTIWKRNTSGITTPFDYRDDVDLLIISAKNAEQSGQFIFPKTLLAKHKIITNNGIEGKRGTRVYPPWDTVTNKHTEKTQQWQTEYFLSISLSGETDLEMAKKLICVY